MSQSLILKAAGLYTHPNNISDVPDGALVVADNVTIDREGLIAPRRGFDRLTYGFSDAAYRANKLHVYQDTLLSHYSSATLAYYNGSGWTNYSGSFSPVDASNKVRFAEANQNLYFTTSTGVKKLDVYSGTPKSAGAIPALSLEGTTTGASGFLANGYKVAYRLLWYYKDTNNNYIYGAPSERAIVENAAGGDRDVQLTVTVPSGIDTTWYYQIYRSAQYPTSGADPNDELGLVYEAAYVSGTTFTVTDSTVDDLRGASIYTASSQEGIANANTQPPLAKDIAAFKGSMFYANTKSKHRMYITLLAVGGSSGIAADDTITIAGTVYTAKASVTVASGYFKVTTGSSAEVNIALTAQSLVKVINQYTSNTSVYAYYISGPDDLPGKIMIEERTVGGSTFYAVSSRSTCWTPKLPTSGTTIVSSNDTYEHGLFFSKYQQPESVPLTNYFLIGSADKAIIRIIPLRDSLFVLKEDGVFRVMGEAGSFRVDPFDSTARIRGAETAATLNNQIYCLTDQGVVAITDTGVSVISRPIEKTLLEVFALGLDNVKLYSFGVGYETDRKYILSTITVAADTYTTQQFVFNTFTNSWTRWTMDVTCGTVNPYDDKLYFGDGSSKYILKEFKSYGFADHVDYGFTATATAYSSATRALSMSDLDQVAAGDIVYQSASIFSIISAVDATNGYVTLLVDVPFTAGTVTVYKAIDCVVQWAPITGGNPGILKHFREATLLFNADFVMDADIEFASELSGSSDSVTLTSTAVGVWGLFPWGEAVWGGARRQRPIRTYVPKLKQRCSQLNVVFRHAVGYSKFELGGLSVVFEPMSEKVMR
jgi:hypothetical protein